jgi:hypothetical protein
MNHLSFDVIQAIKLSYLINTIETLPEAMLRIRDVYTGSRIQIFQSWIVSKKIPDPGPGSASKNLETLFWIKNT